MTIWTPDLQAYGGPRYKALAAAITHGVNSGELLPGTKLPPQRRLADALAVTTGTVTRAYAEAERLGVVEARVGSGTYVRNPAGVVQFKEERRASGLIDLGLSKMPQVARETFLAKSLQAVSDNAERMHRCLGYQPEAGHAYHRETIAHHLKGEGIRAEAQRMLLTHGGLHAINIALNALCRPGDTVIAEGLSYPGFIQAAKQQSIKPVPVAFDERGMLPDALAAALARTPARAIYLMPSVHNPTAVCMPVERRREIVAIAREHGVLIIEDDIPYVPKADRVEPMMHMAPERVLHLNSFSKGLAGGFRLGSIVAPESVYAKVENAIRANCWMATPMVAEIVCHWIENGYADAVTNLQHQAITQRQALVARYLEGFRYLSQPHALHAWLPLPEPWQAGAFVQALRDNNVVLIGAETFAVGRYSTPPGVRLCIGEASMPDLESALKMIRSTLEAGPEQYQRVM